MISAVVILLQAVPPFAHAKSKELHPQANNPTLAIVDGEPIILDDLKNAQIHDVMVRLHQVQSQVLKEAVLAKLTKNHPELKLDSEVPLPSEDDIVRFYENTPGIKEMGTLEKMRNENLKNSLKFMLMAYNYDKKRKNLVDMISQLYNLTGNKIKEKEFKSISQGLK